MKKAPPQTLPGKNIDPRDGEIEDVRLPERDAYTMVFAGMQSGETPDSGNQFSITVLLCGSEYFSGELERGFS